MKPHQIPFAPRSIPDWFYRLELNPKKRKALFLFILFFISLALFSFLASKQIRFEMIKRQSTLLKGKILEIDEKRLKYEIFIEEEEEDKNYILTEHSNSKIANTYRSGDRIDVFFLPLNPSESLSQFASINYYTYLVISLILWIFAGFISLYYGRDYFRKRDSYELGEPVQAKLTLWQEQGKHYKIQVKTIEDQTFFCVLPRYATKIPINSDVWVLNYNGWISYYWDAEGGLSSEIH